MKKLLHKSTFKKTSKFLVFISLIFIAIFSISSCSNLDVQTLNNKAAELMAQGDIDGAIARLESIQDLNPNFPQTNYNLGIAYEKKGDYEKSIHYLEKAISLNPTLHQAHLTLAVVSEEMTEKLIREELEKLEKENKNLELDKVELSIELKQKLNNYYAKAKIALEEYLKHGKNVKNKDELEKKILEYQEKIKQYKS